MDRASRDRPGACCSRSTRRPTSRARSWPASPARSNGCGRRSWAAGSPMSTPLYAERPFLLRLDGFTVGGRIDAVYGEPDGPWEVVDWKTGRRPAGRRSARGAAARPLRTGVRRDLGKRPEDITLTYLYLASGEEVSHPMEDPDVGEGARRGRAADRSTRGRSIRRPGPQCTLLRLPSRSARRARRGSPRTTGARAYVTVRSVSRSICCLERAVAARRDRSRPR